MKKVSILFIASLITFGCLNKNKMKDEKKPVISFCNVYQDSVFVEEYSFHKFKKGNYLFFTYDDSKNGFTLMYDSLNNELKRINCNHSDTVLLKFELKRFYIQNGDVYPVSEFILDEDEIDGAVCYYLNPALGLLAQKSKTWRIAKFVLFSKADSNYLSGQALLYNLFNTPSLY